MMHTARKLFSGIGLMLLVFSAPATLAQTFFSKGAIITAPGDTIRGEIRFRNNTVVQFKSDQGKSDTYDVTQLPGFVIENTPYVSATWLERDSTKRAFVRELLKGHMGLYGLWQPDGELSYLLRLPDQTFVPLRGKTSWNMLQQYMGDCEKPAFRTRMESSQYRYAYPYFETIVNAYNRCVAPQAKSERKRRPVQVEAGILGGAAVTQWIYGAVEDRFQPIVQPNGIYPAYKAITYGGYLTIMPQKRLSLVIEGYYGKYKGARDIEIYSPTTNELLKVWRYSFEKSYVAIPVSARYKLIDKKAKLYLKAGVSIVKDLSMNGHVRSLSNDYVDYDLAMIKTFSIGYLAGIGGLFPITPSYGIGLELRTSPHIIKTGGVTRVGDLRAFQVVVNVPLLTPKK
nr:hypothetical protein [uncultured Arsenicibacter sp.]